MHSSVLAIESCALNQLVLIEVFVYKTSVTKLKSRIWRAVPKFRLAVIAVLGLLALGFTGLGWFLDRQIQLSPYGGPLSLIDYCLGEGEAGVLYSTQAQFVFDNTAETWADSIDLKMVQVGTTETIITSMGIEEPNGIVRLEGFISGANVIYIKNDGSKSQGSVPISLPDTGNAAFLSPIFEVVYRTGDRRMPCQASTILFDDINKLTFPEIGNPFEF